MFFRKNNISKWVKKQKTPFQSGETIPLIFNNRLYLIPDDSVTTAVYSAGITEFNEFSEWRSEKSLPEILSTAHPFIYNNRIYVVGSVISPKVPGFIFTASISEDGVLGEWLTIPRTTLPSLSEIPCMSRLLHINNDIHILGGQIKRSPTNQVKKIRILNDNTLGEWRVDCVLPEPISHTQLIHSGNRVYLLGGYSESGLVSSVYTTIILEDGTLGVWVPCTNLPIAIYNTRAAIVKNKLYILGGTVNYGPIDKLWVTDILEDGMLGKWSADSSLPAKLDMPAVVVINNEIVIIGGYTDGIATDTVYSTCFNEPPLVNHYFIYKLKSYINRVLKKGK